MAEFQYELHEEREIPMALKWAESNLRVYLWGGPAALYIGQPRRTQDQNDKMWPMLRDIAKQVVWYGEKLADYEWKDVLTAALKRQKVVPGVDGGFVVLGARTSRMTKEELSELIELMYAFGVQHGVNWSEPAKSAYAELRLKD